MKSVRIPSAPEVHLLKLPKDKSLTIIMPKIADLRQNYCCWNKYPSIAPQTRWVNAWTNKTVRSG